MSILVVLEQQGGQWHRMSWETLAAGQQLGAALGEPVEAAVVGKANRNTGERGGYQETRQGVGSGA